VVWRLADHPSTALWCGNNEIEQGWAYWGWRKSMPHRFVDFIKLFCRTLPAVIRRLDPQRPYRACSESSGPPYGVHPKDPRKGDVHYWGVWVRSEPIEAYEKLRSRFVSEFGFGSFSDMSSMRKVIPAAQLRLGSAAIEDRMRWPAANVRDQYPNGMRVLEKYLGEHTGIPDDFERVVYLSMLLQGFAIQTAIEAWRRQKPFCMGGLYWQLDACWPEIGWASLDYHGRWKALHYMARRFFAPVLASAQLVEGGAELYVSSDVDRPLAGRLQWALMSFDGSVLESGREPVRLKPQENRRILRLRLGQHDPKTVFLSYHFAAAGRGSRNVKFFAPFKDLALGRPSLRHRVVGRPLSLAVEVSADRPAFYVYLNQNDVAGHFQDNFFHLMRGETRRIAFDGPASAAQLRKQLSVAHLGAAPMSAASAVPCGSRTGPADPHRQI